MTQILNYQGYCPICEKPTTFVANTQWYRDSLICQSCPGGSVPRERALAVILREMRPNWRKLKIHESSAAKRGVSLKLSEATEYVPSQYYPDSPWGSMVGEFRNENLEALTFPDETFDITVTLDVMEHVYNPDKVFQEVYRTLKKGGVYLCTFPVRKGQTVAWERRFEYQQDGSRKDIKPPEIHGNPVSNEGSIVTVDWGYDLHKQIQEWAPFDVRVCRFADKACGILGEYTEVIICFKR
jgi:SAM-dependent methyltransferase